MWILYGLGLAVVSRARLAAQRGRGDAASGRRRDREAPEAAREGPRRLAPVPVARASSATSSCTSRSWRCASSAWRRTCSRRRRGRRASSGATRASGGAARSPARRCATASPPSTRACCSRRGACSSTASATSPTAASAACRRSSAGGFDLHARASGAARRRARAAPGRRPAACPTWSPCTAPTCTSTSAWAAPSSAAPRTCSASPAAVMANSSAVAGLLAGVVAPERLTRGAQRHHRPRARGRAGGRLPARRAARPHGRLPDRAQGHRATLIAAAGAARAARAAASTSRSSATARCAARSRRRPRPQGVADRVHFLGRVPHARVLALMARARPLRPAQLGRGVRPRLHRGDGPGHARDRRPGRGARGLHRRRRERLPRAGSRRPTRWRVSSRACSTTPRRRRPSAKPASAAALELSWERNAQLTLGRVPSRSLADGDLKGHSMRFDRFLEGRRAAATPPWSSRSRGRTASTSSATSPPTASRCSPLDADPRALGLRSRLAAGMVCPDPHVGRGGLHRRSSSTSAARLPQQRRPLPHARPVHLADLPPRRAARALVHHPLLALGRRCSGCTTSAPRWRRPGASAWTRRRPCSSTPARTSSAAPTRSASRPSSSRSSRSPSSCASAATCSRSVARRARSASTTRCDDCGTLMLQDIVPGGDEELYTLGSYLDARVAAAGAVHRPQAAPAPAAGSATSAWPA